MIGRNVRLIRLIKHVHRYYVTTKPNFNNMLYEKEKVNKILSRAKHLKKINKKVFIVYLL